MKNDLTNLSSRPVSAAALCLGLALVSHQASAQVNQPPPEDPPAPGEEVKVAKHAVSVSADYLNGFGTLQVPFGLSYFKGGINGELNAGAVSPIESDRKSSYVGGSLGYSFGRSWYADFAFSRGYSRADWSGTFATQPASGKYYLNDDWYQMYARYTFPQLQGKRISAYARLGVTYVDSHITADGYVFTGTPYTQDSTMSDWYGNLGAGVGYAFFSGSRFRFSGVLEGEGFAGYRVLDVSENIESVGPGSPLHLDSVVYGGLGRTTLRLEWFPNDTGKLRFFTDVGIQARYNAVTYEDEVVNQSGNLENTFNELLWGPYVRVGCRYSF